MTIATVSFVGPLSTEGRLMSRTADVTITSYTASGEAVTAGTFGLKSLETVTFAGASSLGFVPSWDSTNSKIHAWGQDATGTGGSNTVVLREADTTDNVGVIRVIARGK